MFWIRWNAVPKSNRCEALKETLKITQYEVEIGLEIGIENRICRNRLVLNFQTAN